MPSAVLCAAFTGAVRRSGSKMRVCASEKVTHRGKVAHVRSVTNR